MSAATPPSQSRNLSFRKTPSSHSQASTVAPPPGLPTLPAPVGSLPAYIPGILDASSHPLFRQIAHQGPISSADYHKQQTQNLHDWHRSLEYHLLGQKQHPILAGKVQTGPLATGLGGVVGGVRIPAMIDPEEYHRQREHSVQPIPMTSSKLTSQSNKASQINNQNNARSQTRAMRSGSAPPESNVAGKRPLVGPSHRRQVATMADNVASSKFKSNNPKQVLITSHLRQRSDSHSTKNGTNNRQSFQDNHRRTPSSPPRFIYERYLEPEEIAMGLAQGRLKEGQLRINRRRRQDAYVSRDGMEEDDIFVFGTHARNRALDGDTVVVELLAGEELFEAKKDKENQDRLRSATLAAQFPGSVAHVVASVEEGEDLTDTRAWGKVVGILHRDKNRTFAGTLSVDRPGQKHPISPARVKKGLPKMLWFKPIDARAPFMAVHAEDVPKTVLQNTTAYTDKLFIASIKRWPQSSHNPFAIIEEEIGKIGEIEVETKAILANHNINAEPFNEKVLACLPETVRFENYHI